MPYGSAVYGVPFYGAATDPILQVVTAPPLRPGPSRLDIEIDGLPYKIYVPPDQPDSRALPADTYDVEEVDPLLNRLGSGTTINYSDFPQTVESVLGWENWSAGLSPTRLFSIDNTYWQSQGVDATSPNQLILGPALVTVPFASQPGGPSIRQVDFAGGTYLIAGLSVWKLGSGPVRWNAVLSLAAAQAALFTDLAVFNNLLCACALASNSDAGSGGTVSYGASTLTDTSKSWTVNQWAGRAVLAGGQTNVVLSNTATVLTMSTAWASTPGAATAYTIDTHLAYYTSANGASWAQVTYAGTNQDAPKAELFATIRSVLWKVVKPNKIYSCANPTSPSTWSSTATFVGDQTSNITSIIGYSTDVAIGKEDGLWTVDRAGNDFPVVPELRSAADPKNCQNMKLWRTGIMFRVRNGLYRYQRSKLDAIGLDRFRAQGITGSGKVLQTIDLAPYTGDCFALLQPTDNTGIYLASFQENPARWHIFAGQFSGTPQGTCLAVSANAVSGAPTLWVGRTTAGTYDTFYVRLPSATENPLDDTGYVYGGAASITLPELSPIPDQQKQWAPVRLRVLQQGSGLSTVSLGFAADAAIDTQTFTPMVGPQGQQAQSGLFQEWFYPATAGTNPGAAHQSFTARAMQHQLTLTPAFAGSDTPVIKHMAIHFKHRPQPRLRWKILLNLEDKVSGRGHYVEKRPVEVQFHDLQRSRITEQPVSLIDIVGDTYSVFFEKMGHRLQEMPSPGRPRLIVAVELLQNLGTSQPALPPKSTP